MYVNLDAKHAMWKAITVEPGKTILDARNIMLKYNISRVIVAKNDKPVGLLTEKDISRFLYREVPSRRIDEITVDEVMSKNPVTIDEDLDLRRCAKLMLDKGISSLVVVDKAGSAKGVVTKTDLMDAYVRHFAGEHLVKEFMTKKVLTMAPGESIHMAMLLMDNHKVSRIVVVKEGQPVGIVTTRDLLPVSAIFGTGTVGSYWTTREDVVAKKKQQWYIPTGVKAVFVATDVMTRDPITILQDSDLADAGYIMLRNRISGLPVVNRNKKLAGIVTKTDVVRALAAHG